jgi:hypothetical protein
MSILVNPNVNGPNDLGLIIGGTSRFIAQTSGSEFTAAAATFTTLTSSNPAGTTTRLTSAGVHGLTAGSNGRYLWISAAAGITAGLYAMTYVDTTKIDLATSVYSALTTPVATLVNVQSEIYSVSIPANTLGAYGYLHVTGLIETGAAATAKVLQINFGGSAASEAMSFNGASLSQRRLDFIIANQGATNVQRCSMALDDTASAAATVSLTKDTTTALTLQITGLLTAADTYYRISNLRVVAYPYG